MWKKIILTTEKKWVPRFPIHIIEVGIVLKNRKKCGRKFTNSFLENFTKVWLFTRKTETVYATNCIRIPEKNKINNKIIMNKWNMKRRHEKVELNC